MRRVIGPLVVTPCSALARVASVLAVLAVAAACETTSAPAKAGGAPSTAKATIDVDPAALCQVKAEIDDAASRLQLADLRARFHKTAAEPTSTDRAARFGAMLAIADEQERFKAFHDDAELFEASGVGPLGECFVYAAWKMADQATGRCQMADDRLQGAAIVDVARAELHRKKGNLEQARALVDNALSVDNGCTAAIIEGARVEAAQGENAKALALWERARASWPQCYLCAVEAAKLTELTASREQAVPLWEAALALQPDAPDALKRYGAALAGSDDAKALAAYERAVAAGQADVSTLMAAAQLAHAAGHDDKALGFAEKAAATQANDIDAWRLILTLAQKKGDAKQMLKASAEILRLVDEDLPALVVLARDARANDKLVDAVRRYDAAGRAIAAGRTSPLVDADVQAVSKEHNKLLAELKVAPKPAKGTANAVIASVQKTVQGVFIERLKKKKTLQGMIEVAVTVQDGGTVDDVEIVQDTLGDAVVTASVVANLRRAQISGGAKRYSFQMEFK